MLKVTIYTMQVANWKEPSKNVSGVTLYIFKSHVHGVLGWAYVDPLVLCLSFYSLRGITGRSIGKKCHRQQPRVALTCIQLA